jgi:hypothetical protein
VSIPVGKPYVAWKAAGVSDTACLSYHVLCTRKMSLTEKDKAKIQHELGSLDQELLLLEARCATNHCQTNVLPE